MGPEGSLATSQEPATVPYTWTYESSSHRDFTSQQRPDPEGSPNPIGTRVIPRV
jgi:hypothetical protein